MSAARRLRRATAAAAAAARNQPRPSIVCGDRAFRGETCGKNWSLVTVGFVLSEEANPDSGEMLSTPKFRPVLEKIVFPHEKNGFYLHGSARRVPTAAWASVHSTQQPVLLV